MTDLQNVPSYPKISNIYKRTPDGKQLLFGVYADDYFAYLADNQWLFTEKADGTNVRIYWDGDNIHVLGKRAKSQLPKFLEAKLKEEFAPKEEIFEELFGRKEVVLIGEGIGPRIQGVGKCYAPEPTFILIDVLVSGYDPARDGETPPACTKFYFLNRPDIESVAQRLAIPVVPVLLKGTLEDGVTLVKSQPTSTIAQMLGGTGCTIEGIVGVPMIPVYDKLGQRVIVKIKVRDFR